ncbi:MAG: hypothetical protein U5N26_05125 [Candidatus Marinimicrobia bacterium]|nr:hypothetical protein [Candidatus Neomarinimicrobiota bacterium]
MSSGSENTLINPAGLKGNSPKPLYLYHASWFRNEVTASSAAYAFDLRGRVLGLMISRIGITDIPDSRNALLDYGEDGIPGTGDRGEGNGVLDENEILDYDNIRYAGIANYALHLGVPLFEKGAWTSGISFGLLFTDLIGARGYGLSFDMYAQHEGKHVRSLYAVRNLPSAMTVFSNGSTQFYAPKVKGAWLIPVEAGDFRFLPGISAGISFRQDLDYALFRLGEFAALDIMPVFRVQYRGAFSAGIGYRHKEGLHAGVEIGLPLLDVNYAFRPSVKGDLGSSHLISLRLSTDIFK